MKNKTNAILICVLIGLCFLWTGSGYLTWMYHLLDFYPSTSVDVLTEVVGYIFQALGLIFVSFCIKRNVASFSKQCTFPVVMVADLVFIILSALVPNGVLALLFGYCMNLFHGFVAGLYLTLLVTRVNQQNRGIVFGLGYALGSVGSHAISLIGNNNFLKSNYVLIIYTLLVLFSIFILYIPYKNTDSASITSTADSSMEKSVISLALITVLLLCFVKGMGFYFPSSDLSDVSFSLELSRVFYAFGLIVAGIINDKNRKWGAVCCIATLVLPFAMLALKNNLESSFILWIISYLFFGFFAVYRVIIFTDMASKSKNCLYLAGLGLMIGRCGDALGAYTGIVLNAYPVVLILCTSAAFVVTVFLFISLYNRIYTSALPVTKSRETLLEEFQKLYQLSPCEMEVFQLVLDGRSNTEIADYLFISYNTVKFHIKNLFKKTGCSSRTELLELFKS